VETRHRPETGKTKTMPTLHNARSDRVAAAPSWRGPFAKRRAVIPAAGYYEWLATEDADGKPFKQPYFIHPADGGYPACRCGYCQPMGNALVVERGLGHAGMRRLGGQQAGALGDGGGLHP
jgi:SOS response associated peptidase (SRAP)